MTEQKPVDPYSPEFLAQVRADRARLHAEGRNCMSRFCTPCDRALRRAWAEDSALKAALLLRAKTMIGCYQ